MVKNAISKILQFVFSIFLGVWNKVWGVVHRKPISKRSIRTKKRNRVKLSLNLNISKKENENNGLMKAPTIPEIANPNVKRRYKVRRILSRVRYVTVPLSNGQVILERFTLNNNQEEVCGRVDTVDNKQPVADSTR